MKLAIAQMVLGVLILADYFYGLYVGRFAGSWTRTICSDGECLRIFTLTYTSGFTFCLLLGLAVLGCGVAQFLKARRR